MDGSGIPEKGLLRSKPEPIREHCVKLEGRDCPCRDNDREGGGGIRNVIVMTHREETGDAADTPGYGVPIVSVPSY